MKKLSIEFPSQAIYQAVLGPHDKRLKQLHEWFKCEVFSKEGELFVSDNAPLDKIEALMTLWMNLLSQDIVLKDRDYLYIYHIYQTISHEDILHFYTSKNAFIYTVDGKPIAPITISQDRYLKKLKNNTLIFGMGPAGTGKTYLAVMDAVKALKKGLYKKILLTRPAVEAGENLGFLPGDLKEKIDPYLRPLYDALHEALGKKTTEEYIEKGIIEIAPLAYMRGRTLENAYVILDEAQNTTKGQMKLFLTRLGLESKMVVTGDITQIDLPKKTESGMVHASLILKDIDDIAIHVFDALDVVRHPLIQKILERYDA